MQTDLHVTIQLYRWLYPNRSECAAKCVQEDTGDEVIVENGHQKKISKMLMQID